MSRWVDKFACFPKSNQEVMVISLILIKSFSKDNVVILKGFLTHLKTFALHSLISVEFSRTFVFPTFVPLHPSGEGVPSSGIEGDVLIQPELTTHLLLTDPSFTLVQREPQDLE